MTDNFDRDPIAEALRESLARHAAEAPRGDMLAERIINTAERGPLQTARPRRGWRTWALPVVAAGAVAGVVATIIGIQDFHPNASAPPADSVSPSILNTAPVTTT